MPLTIFLDSGPLGLLTNPKRTADTIAATKWAIAMMLAGHRFVVPAIADYEVRRELVRAGKARGLTSLDRWNNVRPDRYLPLNDAALHLAADLWAQARNAGSGTADPKALDADMLIAAQAINMGLPRTEFIIATVNVGHLALFAPAGEWRKIKP